MLDFLDLLGKGHLFIIPIALRFSIDISLNCPLVEVAVQPKKIIKLVKSINESYLLWCQKRIIASQKNPLLHTWVSFVACFHRLCGSWSISCRDRSKLKGCRLRLHEYFFFNIIFQNVSGRGFRWLSCSWSFTVQVYWKNK